MIAKYRKWAAGAAVVLGLAAYIWAAIVLTPPAERVQAAVITPVVQSARGPEAARLATFYNRQVITSDTRACFDLKDYETLDYQYQVDATAGNATTVTLQQTNIDPTAGPFNSANVIATVPATPADADVMSQAALFGRWNCLFVDVTNSNPITFTVVGVAK